MAVGFGSTRGSATTDRIAGLTTTLSTFSFFCWANRNGDGGGGFGRIFDKSSLFFGQNGTAATVYALGNAGGTAFTFTRPSANVWSSVGITWDLSSGSNDPTVFLDGSKLTVGSGLTQVGSNPPSWNGTSSSQIIYGNRSGADRVWDGDLAEPAWWDVALTDDEFYALADRARPSMVRPGSILTYLPMLRNNGQDAFGDARTVTGTANQAHPPMRYPGRVHVVKASAGGGGGSTILPQMVQQGLYAGYGMAA